MKSNQQLKKLKALLEKEHGRTITEDELIRSHWFAEQYANILNDGSQIEYSHKKKLEENPKGFHIKGNFTLFGLWTPDRE